MSWLSNSFGMGAEQIHPCAGYHNVIDESTITLTERREENSLLITLESETSLKTIFVARLSSSVG